jgi:hypothetical protein
VADSSGGGQIEMRTAERVGFVPAEPAPLNDLGAIATARIRQIMAGIKRTIALLSNLTSKGRKDPVDRFADISARDRFTCSGRILAAAPQNAVISCRVR